MRHDTKTMTININEKLVGIVAGVVLAGGGLLYAGVKIGKSSGATNVNPEPTKVEAKRDVGEPDVPARAGTGGAAQPAAKAPNPTKTGGAGAGSTGSTGGSAGGSGVDAQLRQLLTSSAWCSFSYSQYSGSTSTTRFVFGSDGSFSMGGQNESYNSGDYGSVAGQSNSSGGGQWKIQNTRLYISSADTGYQFVDVNADLSYNSSGYPIIKANGTEFSQCN